MSSCKADTNEFQKDLSALHIKKASADQIKKTYRKMALRYHPDVCDPSDKEEFTRMFIELHKAYVSLLDQDSQQTDTSEDFRNKWGSQLSELKRRSRTAASWGSRMRANNQNT